MYLCVVLCFMNERHGCFRVYRTTDLYLEMICWSLRPNAFLKFNLCVSQREWSKTITMTHALPSAVLLCCYRDGFSSAYWLQLCDCKVKCVWSHPRQPASKRWSHTVLLAHFHSCGYTYAKRPAFISQRDLMVWNGEIKFRIGSLKWFISCVLTLPSLNCILHNSFNNLCVI